MSNLPEFMRIARFEYRDAYEYTRFLEHVDRVPYAEIEDAEYELGKKAERLRIARKAYESLPKVCRCGSKLVGDGDIMRCPECGKFYFPETDPDPIPF